MGYLEDQRLPSERAEEEGLPPPAYTQRESAPELWIHANTERLSTNDARFSSSNAGWSSHDPRNTSTDSLAPQANRDGRRKLLLIYIHGFMGDETSFQSFPAHVHHLTTDLMAGTHIVHTKIYPRYKSRRAIEFARDEFSEWLRPHESAYTDVVLLGHSMGGILGAEVVLKPSNSPQGGPFVHRILGTINFDVPFLGMHPGVIASGLGSLFRPADKSSEFEPKAPQHDLPLIPMEINGRENSVDSDGFTYQTASTRSGTQSPASSHQASRSVSQLSIPIDDPNYNPQFENDVVRPVRKGWESALHFMNKHSGGLRHAAKAYVTSHVEFGGTMADYPKLHARYKRIRALEDVNDGQRVGNHGSSMPRVRFVNFYTASTGIQPKARNKSVSGNVLEQNVNGRNPPLTPERSDLTESVSTSANLSTISANSIENSGNEQTSHNNNTGLIEHIESVTLEESKADEEGLSLINPITERVTIEDSAENQAPSISTEDLPPIPDEPVRPPDFDPATYEDKDVLKLAQKDHSRKMRAYQSAVKDREKAIGDRQKMLEKRQKKAAKEEEKAAKEKQKAAKEEAKAAERAAKLKEKEEREQKKAVGASADPAHVSETPSQQLRETVEQEEPSEASKEKKLRDRKFCITPSKQGGMMDPTWVRVFMEGVDEVGAHCGLFFQDKPHYEDLVKDVGKMIQEWITRNDFVRGNR